MRIINKHEIEAMLIQYYSTNMEKKSAIEELIIILDVVESMSDNVIVMLENFIEAINIPIIIWKLPDYNINKEIIEITNEYRRRLYDNGSQSQDLSDKQGEEAVDLYSKFQRVHFYSNDQLEIRNLNAYVDGRYNRR